MNKNDQEVREVGWDFFPLKIIFCPLKWHMAPMKANIPSEYVTASL